MIDVKVIRYSKAFKRHVVAELESGRLASHAEARAKYGIRGGSTVSIWLRKYGKNHLLRKGVRVETPNERDQVKALKLRIRQLERAVADRKVKETLAEAYFEMVCEEFGVADMGALKKVSPRSCRTRPRARIPPPRSHGHVVVQGAEGVAPGLLQRPSRAAAPTD